MITLLYFLYINIFALQFNYVLYILLLWLPYSLAIRLIFFGHTTTINYPSKICQNQLPIFERWVAFAFNLLIFPFLISLLTSLGLSVRLWVNRSNVSLDHTGYRSNCQIICSFWNDELRFWQCHVHRSVASMKYQIKLIYSQILRNHF